MPPNKRFEGGVPPIKQEGEKKPQGESWMEGKTQAVGFRMWNEEKGFGFLQLKDGRDAFCHISELCAHVSTQLQSKQNTEAKRPTTSQTKSPVKQQTTQKKDPLFVKEVVSETRDGKLRFRVRGVECVSCAEPPKWGWIEEGEPIFGVRRKEAKIVNKEDAWGVRRPAEFSYEAEQKINEPYRIAETKKRIWDDAVLNNAFFSTFGEPKKIELTPDHNVRFVFGMGEKIVSPDRLPTERWKNSPTGRLQVRNKHIEAEWEFDEIPGAKKWDIVASLALYPEMYESYTRLSEDAQDAVKRLIMEYISTPEEYVQKKMQEHFSPKDWRYSEIKKIRGNIRRLEQPGPVNISSGMSRETIHYGESADGMISAGEYEANVESWYLQVGGRAGEFQGNFGHWSGGAVFGIRNVAERRRAGETVTAETVRQELIQENRVNYEKQIAAIKRDIIARRKDDLLTSFPELLAFEKQVEELKNILIAKEIEKWDTEDDEIMRKAQEEWNAYEETANKIREYRMQKTEIEKRAEALLGCGWKQKIGMESEGCSWGTIGNNSLEELQGALQSFEEYFEKVNGGIKRIQQENENTKKEIARAYHAQEAEFKAAMEAPATPVQWMLLDVDPKVFTDLGRKVGDGFGARVVGRKKAAFLPGDHAPIGIGIPGGSNRYSKRLKIKGMLGIYGETLDTDERILQGRGVYPLIGLAQNADWYVAQTDLHDGEPMNHYVLYNQKGYGNLYWGISGRNTSYKSSDWAGNEGKGPTMEEVKAMFNLGSKPAQKTPNIHSEESDSDKLKVGLSNFMSLNKKQPEREKEKNIPTPKEVVLELSEEAKKESQQKINEGIRQLQMLLEILIDTKQQQSLVQMIGRLQKESESAKTAKDFDRLMSQKGTIQTTIKKQWEATQAGLAKETNKEWIKTVTELWGSVPQLVKSNETVQALINPEQQSGFTTKIQKLLSNHIPEIRNGNFSEQQLSELIEETAYNIE